MQINLIGHASIFVETQDCRILMDPVLSDSGISDAEQDICPKRQIVYDQIPEFDILIISHRHIDHFDIRSLASLPKHIDVLIPKDKFMKECLRRLGYNNIYCLKDFHEVRIGSTRLITTHSENPVPEFGMIFADPDGVFWNQVDSDIDSSTINKIKSDYPQIDFLLAVWQPLLHSIYQNNRRITFPYSAYSKILRDISLTNPKAIAPGACGFKQINGSAWLNQIVFPVTREQFCEDIKQVFPHIGDNVFTFDPGDVITINNGEVSYLAQSSTFVKKIADDYDSLYFSPVNTDSKLIDNNPDGYDIEEMRSLISEEVYVNLLQFFQENKDLFFIEYCHWKVIYQLEVVFPNDSENWYFDFSKEVIECQKGKNPLANAFSYITASSFYGLLQGFKGWDWVNMGGYNRCFYKVYQATSYGIIKPPLELDNSVVDPLKIKFPYKETYKNARNFEIEKWGKINVDKTLQTDQTKNKNPMVAIGKTLIKPEHKVRCMQGKHKNQ